MSEFDSSSCEINIHDNEIIEERYEDKYKDIDIFKNYTFQMKKFPENNIFLMEDFISHEHCNEIIDIINKYANKEEKWKTGKNVQCDYINLNGLSNDELKDKYDKIIFDYIHKFIEILHFEYKIDCKGDSGYCLRKIKGSTRFHIDGVIDDTKLKQIPANNIRNMSIIIALNDDYEGGIFHFPNQNFNVKLKKGQLIAFPPYWSHLHGVESPENGTFRYTINTWLYE
mgnify:CR=1 FL=1